MSIMNSLKKLNRNKKGFSLVELLVAVAIIAIVTPVLIEGFIYASRLNYRSRLQQRVDGAANSVYEGIASVEFDELEHYLSAENGWEAIDDEEGAEYTYYVSKKYELQEGDTLEHCEIKVSIQEYSESYIVPDLNLIGVNSKFLTLSGEINSSDGVSAEKIVQAIKTDEEVKTAIKYDIVQKIKAEKNIELKVSDIVGSKILIDCGKIDMSKVSKQLSVRLNADSSKFTASYDVSYRYPASKPNPAVDDETLKVSYTYNYYDASGGGWISVKNAELDIQEALRNYYNNQNYKHQFCTKAVSNMTSAPAAKNDDGFTVDQTIFMYYDPVSSMDWIDIKAESTLQQGDYKVYFIEQSNLDDDVLNISTRSIDENNNFKFDSYAKENDCVSLLQSGKAVKIYSNNKSISSNGIPDSIYESSEAKVNMYRVQVSVIYNSTIFANVSGDFKAGGGNVDKYQK